MENRNALIVDAALSPATGTAERDAGLLMLDRRTGRRRITLGADKAYYVSAFVDELRARAVIPAHRRRRPRDQDRQAAQDQDRWPHHAPSRLCREPAHPQAHRGELRLDQDRRRPGQDPPPRPRACGVDVHAHRGRLQPDPAAQAAGGGAVMGPMTTTNTRRDRLRRHAGARSRIPPLQRLRHLGRPRPNGRGHLKAQRVTSSAAC
jgi:hypothetical protein